ncbi:transcription factor GTE4-like [Bidens hawaiensis]|uniref:transcription factor GTE4-like n=1 Tax=Bidens hawaiensis TaxID=980011 RepID=UPI00404A3881
MTSRVPPGNGGGKFGFRKQENRITIELTSRSKKEMKEIKRRLVNELELVRRLVKKIEENGSKPLHQLGISVLENSDNVDKDNLTPNSNQFYRKPDVLAVKDRVPANASYKKSKTGVKKQGNVDAKFSNKVFKSCGTLLEKLMKHKHGWVFNTPVDPLALGLHDYFDIIKHPMDLGTVKSRLDKNWYNSPMEFAEDVRLTFQNAMTYNTKGQDVHAMAELLLKLFEDKWKIIEADYIQESKFAVNTPTSKQAPPQLLPVSSRVEASVPDKDPKPNPTVVSHTGRTPSLKKPKAKDPNKREMTYEEKQKLSMNLQNLPSEKLDHVVKIIKKRIFSLSQKDDEIEVDIDTFDTETLWELDRFVSYYKKEVNKNKRKAEFSLQETIDVEPNVEDNIQNLAPMVVDAPKVAETDERIGSANSPIQIEKQAEQQVDQGNKSSSSSSISGSSSSDSDCDSLSGARSDAAHSSKA